MLVHIVVATLPDNSAMDTERMGKVEDLDPEIARAMVNAGTGRIPTEEELAEYRGEHPEETDDDKAVDGPRPVADEPYKAIPVEEWQAQQAEAQHAEAEQAVQADKSPRTRKTNGGEQPAGPSAEPAQ